MVEEGRWHVPARREIRVLNELHGWNLPKPMPTTRSEACFCMKLETFLTWAAIPFLRLNLWSGRSRKTASFGWNLHPFLKGDGFTCAVAEETLFATL